MTQDHDSSIAATEQLLMRAGTALEYPSTPDLASLVAVRMNAAAEPRSWEWSRSPGARFAGAAFAALVAVCAMVLAVPASRTAVADFLGLDNVRVDVEPSATALPTVPSEEFGRAVTLAEANEILDFQVDLPEGQEPDAAYVIDDSIGPAAVILVYEDEAFELWESERMEFGKGVRSAAFVHEVRIHGKDGVWIEPGHTAYMEEAGLRTFERRVERGALLWKRDGTTYRLETSQPLEEAIELAESIE